MDDILLMAGATLALCGWNLVLQRRNRRLRKALHGAMLAMLDIANGVAVVEKSDSSTGFILRIAKNDTETR